MKTDSRLFEAGRLLLRLSPSWRGAPGIRLEPGLPCAGRTEKISTGSSFLVTVVFIDENGREIGRGEFLGAVAG